MTLLPSANVVSTNANLESNKLNLVQENPKGFLIPTQNINQALQQQDKPILVVTNSNHNQSLIKHHLINSSTSPTYQTNSIIHIETIIKVADSIMEQNLNGKFVTNLAILYALVGSNSTNPTQLLQAIDHHHLSSITTTKINTISLHIPNTIIHTCHEDTIASIINYSITLVTSLTFHLNKPILP